VFSLFAKPSPTVTPTLRRMLIVDPETASARALGELLRRPGGPEIWAAPDAAKAFKLAGKVDPDLIFCELAAGKLDGAAFTRALRRSDLACRRAPVVLVAAEPSAQAVLAARDAGAHEFLRRPILAKDLARRLEAATVHPRDWVEAMDYVGPDRRRFNSADYPGPLKRLADESVAPHAVRVGEGLKIVRAALAGLGRDPAQARRALKAQAAMLGAVGAETADARLAAAAGALSAYLDVAGEALDAAQAHRCAEALLAYGGREDRAAA